MYGKPGHFIANCPNERKGERDDKDRKNKKKKYSGEAHIGKTWDSNNEDSDDDSGHVATMAIHKTSSSKTLFSNLNEEKGFNHKCFMAKESKRKDNWCSIMFAMAGGITVSLGTVAARSTIGPSSGSRSPRSWPGASKVVTVIGPGAGIPQAAGPRHRPLRRRLLPCYALFVPAFNLATNDHWRKMPDGVPRLAVYTAYSTSTSTSPSPSSPPASGSTPGSSTAPMTGVVASSLAAYARDGGGRGLTLLAGVVCGLGNAATFIAGQAAGYAAADSVMALPLVW
ncbi:hypothetical protein PR202_ga25728 [Eleusine coracana subsp. coracana]|uniref:Uncharacterized protein n=1 Tax=Eleusine coracana subsp. coracana TaxID=191504 RepID=A0AAV5DCB4_ELECO|nr:hypothetical protein PR202_ga25728 [Eleusine coracana subsp. coracana]